MRTELGSERIAALARQAVAEIREREYPIASGTAVEVEGETFTYLGEGSDRMAVLGPDGVVYKTYKYWTDRCNCAAHRNQAADAPDTQTENELELFDKLAAAEIPWCPDYYAYGPTLAMRRYEVWRDSTHKLADAVEKDMWAVSPDVTKGNVGFDADGNPYLLDGGLSYFGDLDKAIARISTRGKAQV